MDLKSTERCKVFVEVRSKGFLGAMEHHLVFSCAPNPFEVRGVGDEVDVAIETSVDAMKLMPPDDTSPSDRERMLDNLRGRDVLDVKKWPTIGVRARYRGTLEAGKLDAEITVRGVPRKIALDVRGRVTESGWHFDASWEGTQGDLGLKPFRAMLGALQLRDWAKIRVEVDLERV